MDAIISSFNNKDYVNYLPKKNFAVTYFGCVALIQHELFYLVIFCV